MIRIFLPKVIIELLYMYDVPYPAYSVKFERLFNEPVLLLVKQVDFHRNHLLSPIPSLVSLLARCSPSPCFTLTRTKAICNQLFRMLPTTYELKSETTSVMQPILVWTITFQVEDDGSWISSFREGTFLFFECRNRNLPSGSLYNGSLTIGIETLQIIALMTLSQEHIAMFSSYLSFDYSLHTRKVCRAAKDLLERMPPYRLQPIVEDFLSQNLYMISSTKDALAHPLGVSVGQNVPKAADMLEACEEGNQLAMPILCRMAYLTLRAAGIPFTGHVDKVPPDKALAKTSVVGHDGEQSISTVFPRNPFITADEITNLNPLMCTV
uniref:Uncharacterized protein n=1 Tax=Cucumis melo TaxID=3656 RepID=A0A9I9EEH1_CUCME